MTHAGFGLSEAVIDELSCRFAVAFYNGYHFKNRTDNGRMVPTPGIIYLRDGRDSMAIARRLCDKSKRGNLGRLERLLDVKGGRAQVAMVHRFVLYLISMSLLHYSEGGWQLDYDFMHEHRSRGNRSQVQVGRQIDRGHQKYLNRKPAAQRREVFA